MQDWCEEEPLVIERAEGTRPDRRRRPALPRRRLVALVQRPRPSPPGDRQGDPRPARPRRPLDDARPHATSPAPSSPRRLVEIAPPGLNRVFFSDSGSTATEIALKMAFQYWQQQGGEAGKRRSLRLPARRLPRRHGRGRLGRRDRPVPRHLRAAAVRRPPRAAGRRRASSSACSTSTTARSRR